MSIAAAIAVAGEPTTPPRSSPAQHRKRHRRGRAIVAPIIGLGVFIGLWYLHALLGAAKRCSTSRASSSRRRTVSSRIRSSTAIPREQMLRGLGWTTFVALVGLSISIVLGMLLAVVMAQATWLERSFWPYLIAAQAIPILAIVPHHRYHLRLRVQLADPRVRDHLDLPDRVEHAVRAAVGRAQPARPVHAARRVAPDPAAQAAAPGRAARRSSPASASPPACR